MRDNKRLDQNIPISRQTACWTELHEITDNLGEMRDARRLPALRCVDEFRPTYNNSDSQLSSLPPIPPKRNIKTHVPPQQRAHLTTHMPQISNQRPHHNIMDRYREPYPPKDKRNGERNGDERAHKAECAKHNAYIKARNVDVRQASADLDIVKQEVVITEGDKGFRYNINPELCLDEDRLEKLCRASVEAKAAAKSKVASASSARPVTTIRSIVQCADAPLLPGRREPMVPHPPLEPYNLRSHGIVHPHMAHAVHGKTNTVYIKEDANDEGTKLPSISKPNKNIFVCHPPNAPKLTGNARHKWRKTTIKRNN